MTGPLTREGQELQERVDRLERDLATAYRVVRTMVNEMYEATSFVCVLLDNESIKALGNSVVRAQIDQIGSNINAALAAAAKLDLPEVIHFPSEPKETS